MKTLFLIASAIIIMSGNQFAQSSGKVKYDAKSKSIVVPEVKGSHIVTDGIFSVEEWENALNIFTADIYNIYVKADREILYVGLRADKPIGECVCEIRITSDEKEVFLLHVSGALGESVSGFPATTTFKLNNNKHWEANFLKADSLKKASWFAKGQPIEKYSDIYNKRDGIEFKINRNMFKGNSVKFTIGWVQIDVKDKKIDKRTYNYPENASLKNADDWAVLILHAGK